MENSVEEKMKMLVKIECIGEGRVLEGMESLREDEELWGAWGALGKMKIPVEDREHWGG